MSTRYAVSLNDPINLHVLYASTPFEAVRQAQISMGSLDRYPPGRYTFRVTPGLRLVPECEVLEDPCGGDCECERLLRGSADDIDVPVVLDWDAAGYVVLTPDTSGPATDQPDPTATGPVEVPCPSSRP